MNTHQARKAAQAIADRHGVTFTNMRARFSPFVGVVLVVLDSARIPSNFPASTRINSEQRAAIEAEAKGFALSLQ